MHEELVETLVVDGVEVEVVGYYDAESGEGEYEYFDLFQDGECLNEGAPIADRPTIEVARAFLR